mmetsp:Transcript_24353/g.36459  ORF Transcript_24353/g.36459 Transcript_24353/m.36459 type:complete len:99 (+) Transcript_24353:143-439(+)
MISLSLMSALCFNRAQFFKNIFNKNVHLSKLSSKLFRIEKFAISIIIYNPRGTAEPDTFYPNTPISPQIQTTQHPRWDPANMAPGTYHPSSETSYPDC